MPWSAKLALGGAQAAHHGTGVEMALQVAARRQGDNHGGEEYGEQGRRAEKHCARSRAPGLALRLSSGSPAQPCPGPGLEGGYRRHSPPPEGGNRPGQPGREKAGGQQIGRSSP